MEEGQDERRKRLRAMATEAAAVAQNDIPLAAVPPASSLPNPLANMPHPPPPPYPPGPPHPPPPNWGEQHPGNAYPTSFGRIGGRRGGGRNGRGRGRGPPPGGRGFQRGYGNGPSRGRGGGGRGRGRGNVPTNIEAYYSPQMLSNPWSHLERQQVPARDLNDDDGRYDREGILDRPWH